MARSVLASTLVICAVSLSATARFDHPRRHDHEHGIARSLPKQWYHEDESHPVHKLFTRQEGKNDGQTYPAVGSAEWSAIFPAEAVNVLPMMRQEWKDALKAAEDAGKIPKIPQTTVVPDKQPVYPDGVDGASQDICNAGFGCRQPDDIWNGLDGHFGVNFDDGPFDKGSEELYDFLSSHGTRIPTTHFVVGRHIRNLPQMFNRLVNEVKGDLAVHTYTHRQLTPLSNEEVVAELAWTMEIIRQSSGGRIPRFWRPPTGDADNRIRALAKEVLGMEMIMWNFNTDDFTIAPIEDPAARQAAAESNAAKFKGWIEGPKSPGLIVLEHETSTEAVKMFKDAVPLIEGAGWKWASVVQITEGQVDPFGAYSNVNGEGDVSAGVIGEVDEDDDEPADGGDETPDPTDSGSQSPPGGPSSSTGGPANPTNTPENDEESKALALGASYLIAGVSAAIGAFNLVL
ncbi:hypothetical protein BDV98DRAFT_509458 [Pterulicium gracile]|uniref:chitin deacetylase n=1 Tax=Pterulicium gracile TaxID=1884261 RepID=A0A5C3QDG9_9AGAR|nr:hypothetical protein BDV98DRAFT_509458 [Pterula gracilis]